MSATITPAEKLACVRRELALRRNVYPGLVQRGKLKRDQATREIEIMTAIVEDMEKLKLLNEVADHVTAHPNKQGA